MYHHLAFDFSVDKENNVIRIKREFDALRSFVWDAYTKPELLDQWWAPKPWKARTKTMDFREGGFWLYAMVGPEGQEHWSIANYSNIEAQKKFTGKDAFTDTEGTINKALPQSKWDISFSDKGLMTLVEFNIYYDDFSQLEATLEMGFKEGMATAMEGLDALLRSLKK